MNVVPQEKVARTTMTAVLSSVLCVTKPPNYVVRDFATYPSIGAFAIRGSYTIAAFPRLVLSMGTIQLPRLA